VRRKVPPGDNKLLARVGGLPGMRQAEEKTQKKKEKKKKKPKNHNKKKKKQKLTVETPSDPRSTSLHSLRL